jgi:hypothetical protein
MGLNKYLLSMMLVVCTACLPLRALASEAYSVQLYFGLSIPDGRVVTTKQWNDFVVSQIAPRFDGFNVMDSLGYWRGKAEQSKVVTIIMPKDQLPKAALIAKQYATLYHQDSVMLVHHPVSDSYLSPTKTTIPSG